MAEAERVSLAIEPELLTRFDELVERSGSSRSEMVRDLMRARLIDAELETSIRGDAVGTLTLLYNHAKRNLAERLMEVGHDHHGAIVSTLHVHLDHDNCIEVLVLRGKPKRLHEIAAELIAMKGVMHGKLVMSHAL